MARALPPERVIVAIELVGLTYTRAVCRTGTCTWSSTPWSRQADVRMERDIHRHDHLSGSC